MHRILKYDRFESVNENIIYLDGTEEIRWNELRGEVMKDLKSSKLTEKEIDTVLKSVRKWLLTDHWALPGIFED
jgi:hypothetical protein